MPRIAPCRPADGDPSCRTGFFTLSCKGTVSPERGLFRSYLDSHHRLKPNSALTQQILAQVRLIDLLRRSIQRQANQLRAVLLPVYPQALGLFSKLTPQISLHFLMAYPSPQEAQALTRTAFEHFCREHRYRRAGLISQRYAQLMDPLPEASPAAVAAYRDQIRILAQLLLPQMLQRTQALSHLDQLFSQHPDAHTFDSLPGAADLLAPALLTKFGVHRDRFPTPASVQALAGTCPVTKKSGKRQIVIFRRIVQQFARLSIRQSRWASAYWRDLRPRCRSDSDAYRRLANRWLAIRWLAIIWKMWQDGKAYHETYHLQQRALRRRPRSRIFCYLPGLVLGVPSLGKSDAHQRILVSEAWRHSCKMPRRFRLRIGHCWTSQSVSKGPRMHAWSRAYRHMRATS